MKRHTFTPDSRFDCLLCGEGPLGHEDMPTEYPSYRCAHCRAIYRITDPSAAMLCPSCMKIAEGAVRDFYAAIATLKAD